MKRIVNNTAGLFLLATFVAVGRVHAQDAAQDPRTTLRPGYTDAGVAARNMELVSNVSRPKEFVNPSQLGDILFANSDMAFRGNTLFLGSFHGFQIWDVTNAKSPSMITSLVCPGGQGDVSIYKHLLFMSVEMPNGRTDCGTTGRMDFSPNAERFMGIRVFDVSDVRSPKQVASVQTCRGSHTHTLVTDPRDSTNVYIYVSGAMPVRSEQELSGCSGKPPKEDPNTAYFRIEVIQVPVNAPQNARVVNSPRIFANAQGDIAGLWPGGAHGQGTQSTAQTDQCHDITAFPEMGIAGGACSGNGIILDIKDPANPKRIKEMTDPNFAYWHSATFNNDGTKVVFTDEWGGGMAPRCQSTDPRNWGANAIFDIQGGDLKLASYYKLPAPQGNLENCVAHNGSIVPVPGRDIMVQAWYQGGISVYDFTDSKNPKEIAYFDRGAQANTLQLGGHWSAYWYNGQIYASEITRGLDILNLTPSEHLTQNEIDAAKSARVAMFNPQTQARITIPASFVVARAYVDQLKRGGAPTDVTGMITRELDRIEKMPAGSGRKSALSKLASDVGDIKSDARRAGLLAAVLKDLGN